MNTTQQPSLPDGRRVLDVIRRCWGFDTLRPLQGEAIAAALALRDSLVVLPTGGGKSLCYQAPPLVSGGTDVVISPLIALMKDQVDSLTSVGYPATALHSNLPDDQQRTIERGLLEGKYRLLLVAPERLVQPGFLQKLAQLDVRRFVIDEAHCISHWGHDFRPEYRQLAMLRQRFPHASLHAFTATATERVRDDIRTQLQLREPLVLVGRFDRPNLVYRVLPMADRYAQTLDALQRHKGEAAIVYCLSRKDTEAMASFLQRSGLRAAFYHAGMEAADRRQKQEAFSQERLDVVVATVAFGMGIDRSNVRCVLHTCLPKSIEHYQQETGRAGRDGLEAECVLLYTAADVMRWESLFRKSAQQDEDPAEVAARDGHLRQMQRYASVTTCRHKILSEHFDQAYEQTECGACDVCLGEIEGIAEATVIAQKILSCVARVEQRFGAGHVTDVLVGADTEMIRRCRHQLLSTYALLKEHNKKEVQSWVYQLLDQGLLSRSDGDRPVLQLNDQSWAVLRGQSSVRLFRTKQGQRKRTHFDEQSWEGADRELFDALRQWRRETADSRGIAPFMVLHDSVLQQLSIVRPTRIETLCQVRGIGQRRLEDLGPELIARIDAYCREYKVTCDNAAGASASPEPPAAEQPRLTASKESAFTMFAQGRSLEQVVQATGRARSTVTGYLSEFVAQQRPERIDAWIDEPTYRRIAAAAAASEDGRLKPIFEQLGGEVPYDMIRLVVTHLQTE